MGRGKRPGRWARCPIRHRPLQRLDSLPRSDGERLLRNKISCIEPMNHCVGRAALLRRQHRGFAKAAQQRRPTFRFMGRGNIHLATWKNCIPQTVRKFKRFRKCRRAADCKSAIQPAATLRYEPICGMGSGRNSGGVISRNPHGRFLYLQAEAGQLPAPVSAVEEPTIMDLAGNLIPCLGFTVWAGTSRSRVHRERRRAT